MGFKALILILRGVLYFSYDDSNLFLKTEDDYLNISSFSYSCRYINDPEHIPTLVELHGYRALVDIENETIRIEGYSSRQFEKLLKQSPQPHYLVTIGMASNRYPTREAASSILIRRGISSIPYLLYGLKSKDVEVRERCIAALEQIRLGY